MSNLSRHIPLFAIIVSIFFPALLRAQTTFTLRAGDTSVVQFVYNDSITIYYDSGVVVKAISDFVTDTTDNTLPAIEPRQLLLIKKTPKLPGKYIITYKSAQRDNDKLLVFDVDEKMQITIVSHRSYGDFLINRPSQIVFTQK